MVAPPGLPRQERDHEESHLADDEVAAHFERGARLAGGSEAARPAQRPAFQAHGQGRPEVHDHVAPAHAARPARAQGLARRLLAAMASAMARARRLATSGRREASASTHELGHEPIAPAVQSTRHAVRLDQVDPHAHDHPAPSRPRAWIIARPDGRRLRMGPHTPVQNAVGKYQVEKVLGRGGMGTVYQARDPVIHRTVALKTMTPEIAETPELKARFLREAQAAGGLRHQNIVTVYDLGEDRGQPYIAMEFIEGQDLEKIIQSRQPLSVEWKIDVLRQVCEGWPTRTAPASSTATSSPRTSGVTSEGEVKIMDFGIAHLQSSKMTKSGLVLGTVHYMAPEQVEGQKVDHRADIFSVGAIAYELLAYRRPFDGDSLTQVMFHIMRAEPDLKALPRTDYSPRTRGDRARALAAARGRALPEPGGDARRPRAPRARHGGAPPGRAEGHRRARDRDRAGAAAGQLQKALTMLPPRPPDRSRARGRPAAPARGRGGHSRPGGRVSSFRAWPSGYAADGDLDLAMKISSKVARLAPESARYRDLAAYRGRGGDPPFAGRPRDHGPGAHRARQPGGGARAA